MKFALTILLALPLSAMAGKKSDECAVVLEVPSVVTEVAASRLFDLSLFPKPKLESFRTTDSIQSEIRFYTDRIKWRTKEMEKLTEELTVKDLPGYRRLSVNRDIAEHESMIDNAKRMIASGEAELAERAVQKPKKEDARPKAWEEIRNKIAANPALEGHFRDGLAATWLNSFASHEAVAIFAGMPNHPVPKAQFDLALKIAETATKNNQVVFVDGHAPLLNRLVAATDGKAIRIYTHEVPDMVEPYILVRNRYLLLEIFKHSKIDTFGMDSSGWAIPLGLLDGLENWIGNSAFDDEVNKWVNETNREFTMGLTNSRMIPTYYKGSHQLIGKGGNPDSRTLPPDEKFSLEDLGRAAEYANQMTPGFEYARGAEAVVFGSGSMNKSSSPLIYQVAYEMGRRGIGVATGGAGGAMLAANMGAFDAGADSIGIPITGRNSLSTEKKTYSEFQTLTVEARDYAERVPWLLAGRKIIVVAPGGRGTMREIAASLVELFESPDAPAIVFLDSKYYEGFVNALQKRVFGKTKEKIALIDNVEQFSKWLDDEIASGRLVLNLPETPPAPRSDRKELPKDLYDRPTPKGSYSGSSSWSDSGDATDSSWDFLSPLGPEENI